MDALAYAEHIRNTTPEGRQVLERIAEFAFIRYLASEVIDLLQGHAIDWLEDGRHKTALGIDFCLGTKYASADFSASAEYRQAKLEAEVAALRVERLERRLTRQGKVAMRYASPTLEIKIPFRHATSGIWLNIG